MTPALSKVITYNMIRKGIKTQFVIKAACNNALLNPIRGRY